MQRYDAAIIGTGPAGLEAALNLKIRNKSFLLFGPSHLSTKLVSAAKVDNYLGLPGITGKDLQAQFLAHIQAMDIQITQQQVQMIYPMGDYFALASGQDNYEATTLILATGTSHTKLIEGEEAFLGRGVGYCATCDAPLYRGRAVAVLGYTDEAAHEANYVAELASKVYYIPMHPQAGTPSAPVEVIQGKVTAIEGDSAVHTLVLEDRRLAVDGIFVLRESVAPTSLLPGLEVRDGYIHVSMHMATNIPGCFAAGDCTGKPHQFMRAAGQGQTAGLAAVDYLAHKAKQQKENA